MRRIIAMQIILHNIRSSHNVGSIFRTADGAGVSKIYLTGYTPSPIDRFGREHKEIQKTSLGATQTVPYEVKEDIFSILGKLKKEGRQVVAVEQTRKSSDYRKFETKKDVVFVFGNEITGVEKEVLEKIDTHIEIPMLGEKESLNISVCAGVILFTHCDK